MRNFTILAWVLRVEEIPKVNIPSISVLKVFTKFSKLYFNYMNKFLMILGICSKPPISTKCDDNKSTAVGTF